MLYYQSLNKQKKYSGIFGKLQCYGGGTEINRWSPRVEMGSTSNTEINMNAEINNGEKRKGRWELSERARLGFLCLLLLLTLGCIGFAAVNTFQAVRNFQQQYSAAKSSEVSAIRPWMTIHAISHLYQIPEDYLCSSVSTEKPAQLRHVTLYDIAIRKKQPVEGVIRTIQHAIIAYRKAHPRPSRPTPTPPTGVHHLSATPGGTSY